MITFCIFLKKTNGQIISATLNEPLFIAIQDIYLLQNIRISRTNISIKDQKVILISFGTHKEENWNSNFGFFLFASNHSDRKKIAFISVHEKWKIPLLFVCYCDCCILIFGSDFCLFSFCFY